MVQWYRGILLAELKGWSSCWISPILVHPLHHDMACIVSAVGQLNMSVVCLGTSCFSFSLLSQSPGFAVDEHRQEYASVRYLLQNKELLSPASLSGRSYSLMLYILLCTWLLQLGDTFMAPSLSWWLRWDPYLPTRGRQSDMHLNSPEVHNSSFYSSLTVLWIWKPWSGQVTIVPPKNFKNLYARVVQVTAEVIDVPSFSA